jgi:hypothetical protein
MSYLKGFTECINPNLILSGKTLNGEAACGDIKIKGTYLIIKIDDGDFKHPVLDTIFQAGRLRCICDYIIVSENLILVCELKSNNPGHYKIQLRNSGEIVNYFAKMVRMHSKIVAPIPTIKYVRFANEYKNLKQNEKLDSIQLEGGVELFTLPCNLFYSLNQFN